MLLQSDDHGVKLVAMSQAWSGRKRVAAQKKARRDGESERSMKKCEPQRGLAKKKYQTTCRDETGGYLLLAVHSEAGTKACTVPGYLDRPKLPHLPVRLCTHAQRRFSVRPASG